MNREERNKKYDQVMEELQDLWAKNPKYMDRRFNNEGIRSSQIACLVDYLIEKGAL